MRMPSSIKWAGRLAEGVRVGSSVRLVSLNRLALASSAVLLYSEAVISYLENTTVRVLRILDVGVAILTVAVVMSQ